MVEIICYTGGACGDLLTALIDSRDASLVNNSVTHHDSRLKLKKPHMFNDNKDKDIFLEEIGKSYVSIPSHDLTYHIEKKHNFIGITVENYNVAHWAAVRFKNLHRKEVWENMSRFCGATTVNDYAQILLDYSKMIVKHTNRTIKLEDIINNLAVQKLSEMGFQKCNEEFYFNWLKLQNLKL